MIITYPQCNLYGFFDGICGFDIEETSNEVEVELLVSSAVLHGILLAANSSTWLSFSSNLFGLDAFPEEP